MLELGEQIEDLYWRSIDRPKISHWLAAYQLVSGTLEPHPASTWAKGADALPVDGPPKGLTDAVLPDEFPLSMFYEALSRKLSPVVTRRPASRMNRRVVDWSASPGSAGGPTAGGRRRDQLAPAGRRRDRVAVGHSPERLAALAEPIPASHRVADLTGAPRSGAGRGCGSGTARSTGWCTWSAASGAARASRQQRRGLAVPVRPR